jgi:glycosyltransferase involved in cell wall biosynthesis
MALGKPVVAIDACGPAEIITSGQDGFLVQPGDAEAIARHAIALWKDPRMAAGVPDAIVDGVTGRLVPPADPAAMAEAMHALIQAPVLRRAFGEGARERARQRYRRETMIAKLETVYATATLLTEPGIDGIDRK